MHPQTLPLNSYACKEESDLRNFINALTSRQLHQSNFSLSNLHNIHKILRAAVTA